MAKTKSREFQVTARLVSIVQVDVAADSLEAAVAKSKDLVDGDFIELKGENLDASFKIVGVSENDSWNTD